MESIPETGSGLSGFLAHYLWQIYSLFPSSCNLDWLLLFLLLGLGSRLIFLLYIWRSVESDIVILQEGKKEVDNQSVVPAFWGIACSFFFCWFFQTPAGGTFLTGRQILWIMQVAAVDRVLFCLSLIVLLVMIIVVALLETKLVNERSKASGASRSQPWPTRDFASIYSGGGVFVFEDVFNKGKPTNTVANGFLLELVIMFFAHVFYWYWSAASLILIHCFILTAVLSEGFRMLFVYILHKRTFG